MRDNETPTPSPESNKLDKDIDESIALANQANEAKRFDAETDESIDLSRQALEAANRVNGIQPETKSHTTRNTLLLLAGSAALLVAADQYGQADNVPKPSGEQTVVVSVGQGLDSIVDGIPGSQKYDDNEMEASIAGDPSNIDVLKDGLQAGESLVVPKEYK